MPQENKTWIDNLIIKDNFRKENIPFYQYSEFENVKLIGGNVYKATFKISQKTVALKCVSLNDKFTLDNLINEIKRHRKLEIYDSILRFYGITEQENSNNYMVILEYPNNDSLCQYLITNFQKMDWISKLNIAKQIANALMHLHSNEIIHGKLNSENILVHNGNIKLNYFGISKHTFESLKFQYIDPNTIEKNKCLDIFSLGIILWEISSGKPLFEMESSSNIDLLNNIVKGKREMIIPGTPSKYQKLYTDCWKHDGNSRPDISQVVKNLSEITISDVSIGVETSRLHPNDIIDEVNSVKLEKSNKQNDDVSTEINKSIEDLFEFFIDLYEKQNPKMHPTMIKKYFRECNKNPVKVLYEMIRHPSHYWFTSLIGFFYLYGIGTIFDVKMAFEFFSLATNEIINMKNISSSLRKLYKFNNEMGFIYIANMHLNGQGVKIDRKKAFQMYSKVAEKGSLIALNKVAYCYEVGFGVKKNEEKAFELYLKSAEEGYLVAQYDVGRCYTNAKGISKDETKGFQWYVKSALAGNIFAICNAGYCYDHGKDVKEAFKWYLKAAEKGCSLAQYNLGCCYKDGKGIDEDQVKSFQWYKKAAEDDYTDGQYMVGNYFYQGCGTEKDIVKAIHWLNKANENGSAIAWDLLEEIIDR
ncbi:hypothetical protein Glove_37g66 [Diversispora epigaea]|uniref:Protein kinase domain-containing protein n=1 Tax=Diversispora epigaea TaxID=1348612 RepID=A0A397JKG7_9GLOM|nr:hypothetical protein Glove_37g66 [Diversispora epigaea]